jgi:hypothetical protein
MLDRLYNEPTALLNRAVTKTQPAGPVRAAVQKAASGAASAAKAAAPVAGEDWLRFMSGGQAYRVHPEDADKVRERDPGAKFDQPQQ